MNVQANQEIDIVESSLNKELDGLQSEIDQKFDNPHKSISRLANQHDHREEECPIDTNLGEQAQLQLQEELKEEPAKAPEELQDASQLCVVYGPRRKKEEILPLLSEEGNGKEAGEEPQKPTAQATNSLLPCLDPMHILPKPAAHLTHEPPTAEPSPSALLVRDFRKLVATAQIFSTTLKTLAVAYTAWHSGWFGC